MTFLWLSITLQNLIFDISNYSCASVPAIFLVKAFTFSDSVRRINILPVYVIAFKPLIFHATKEQLSNLITSPSSRVQLHYLSLLPSSIKFTFYFASFHNTGRMSGDQVGQRRTSLSFRPYRLFKLAYYVGKCLGLLPLDYDFRRNLFHTSCSATTTSIVICILVAISSPLALMWNSQIYYVSDADIDENMSLVTTSQFGVDFAVSFVVLVCQLWKRRQLSRSANDFRKVYQQLSAVMHVAHMDGDGDKNVEMGCCNVITLEMVLLIAMKFCVSMYKVLINVPFLIQHGDVIPATWMLGFLLNVYMSQIVAVFSDMVFAVLLVLARYFHLVDDLLEQLSVPALQMDVSAGQRETVRSKQLARLMRVYVRLKRMTGELSTCIGVSLLVQMLGMFTDMLTNLYALLDFYAVEKCLDVQALIYNVMVLSSCCLVFAAERVKRSSSELRDNLLNLGLNQEGHIFHENSFVFEYWPEACEINVLGLFTLDNTFMIFVIAYSSNFIVIILQFELNKLL